MVSLVLITPADDYQLLSATERRLAAGLAEEDSSQDVTLEALGLEAAEWVASICGVPAGDGYQGSPPLDMDCVPTFRREVVQETRTIIGMPRSITLARRFVSGVTATLNGVDLATTDYRVNGPDGTLDRVVAGLYPSCWNSGILVITYTAGFTTVPPSIKDVAKEYLAMRYRQGLTPLDDQAIQSKTINDIMSVTYRNPTDVAATIEDIARRRLDRYLTSNYG